MTHALNVLILEDYESDALLLLRELRRGGYDVTYKIADNAAGLKAALDEQTWDIILSDYSMPGFSATDALKIVRKEDELDIPFIIVSGTVGEDIAVEAMKAGAQDFFSKDKLTRLVSVVERELQEAKERRKRREAEAQHREAEVRFTKAFHANPLAIAITRLADGQFIDVNERFAELFGSKREEMIGQVKKDLWIHPETRTQFFEELKRSGSVNDMEVGFKIPSGRQCYALLSGEVIELNNEPCILNMVYDITDRKLAEQQLERSNDLIALLRDIAIAANEARDIKSILQFTIDHICDYTDWDIGHAYLVSRDNLGDLQSTSIWCLTNEDKFEPFRHYTDTAFKPAEKGLIRTVLDTQQAQWQEGIGQNDNFVRAQIAATCGLYSALAFPIFANQQIVGTFEFFSTRPINQAAREIANVTTHVGTQVGRVIERRWSESALRESEERYRALFDHSLNAVYLHDLEGNFIDANAAALDILGYTSHEITSLTFLSLLHEEDLVRAQKDLQETVTLGYQRDATEYRLRHKNGSWIDVEVISSVIYRNDMPWALQGIARDITERKMAHAEEQARRRFAEALHNTTTALFDGQLDVHKVLGRILQYTREIIPCDAATLMQVESGIARIVHYQGFAQETIPNILKAELEVKKIRNFRAMEESRQPLIIPDTRTYDAWRADVVPELKNILSYLGAPIFVKDQLFGFINLDSQSPNHFQPEHAERLRLLTDQAAVSIHSAQLYEQIHRYTQRLELLHKIDIAILQEDEPDLIAQSVLDHLHSLIPYHSASISTYDLQNMEFTVLANTIPFVDPYAKGTTHPIKDLVALRTLEENELYFISDLEKVNKELPFDQALRTVGIRSYARIPLYSGGKLLGSMNFRSTEPDAFYSENLKIAQEVANQLAIALENTRLLNIEKRRNNELIGLHWASLNITSTLHLEGVLNTALKYAMLLVEAADGHIFLYDGESLTFGTAQWDGQIQTKPLAPPRPNGLTVTVAHRGERIVIPDMSASPFFEETEWTGAIIGIPLIVANKVKGVMSVAFDKPHNFDEYEIRILELLADLAASAIQNAQLYEQTQRHAEELEERVAERTQQLQESKDRVEAILNSSTDSIILTDEKGLVTQVNLGFEIEFGYYSYALLGQPLRTIIASDDHEQFLESLEEVRQHKISRRIEIVAKRRDQSTFPADVLISCFIEGETMAIVCSLRDITLQKQVETDLRLALEKQKELNELKTNFTSIVSHEFRTPLAIIMTSAATLAKYFDKIAPERRVEKLKIIQEQVRRLTRLMDDVLVITRSESIGFQLDPQPLDIVAFCHNIIEDVKIGWPTEVTIEFTYHCDHELIIADPHLFTHILQNLASNAVKYSPDDGRVQIELTCSEDEISLRIADEGIGIPKQHQDKLFESFQRAVNVGNIQGTGIGLTIVKRAVDAYGGQIEFESVEGEGTTFIVKLPHGNKIDY